MLHPVSLERKVRASFSSCIQIGKLLFKFSTGIGNAADFMHPYTHLDPARVLLPVVEEELKQWRGGRGGYV